MKKYLFAFLIQIQIFGLAQEEKKLGVEFNGIVRTDIFLDSRQTEDLREGHFLLYPKSKLLDDNGKDINAQPKFNMMSCDTRLTALIKGPDAFGAKTSGLIEGEFYGNINSDINGFRLRHAMVKLTWKTAELMVGQFWHPMFITSSFPGTVSFNTGAPFQPFARNPQIQLTQKLGNINLIGTMLEQIDFSSPGPGGVSPKYHINCILPELNFRIEYKSDKFLLGGGSNYQSVLPRMYVESVNSKVKTDETVTGLSLFAYAKLPLKLLTIGAYGSRGQLMYSMTNLGGYAEKEYIYENTKLTNITYTPMNTSNLWMDVYTNGKTLQFGFFGGYTKNHGASDSISTAGKIYARGDDIDYIYRISPRVIYNSGKFRIAPEIEYTVAAYATTNGQSGLLNVDNKRAVTHSKEIGNLRFLLGVYYFF